MVRQFARSVGILAVCTAIAAWPAAAALPTLSAQQIVERNVTARGGLAAWRGVTTMIWKGRMSSGGSTYATVVDGRLQTKTRPETELPFRLELKRPNKSRLELEFSGSKAVQIYDGSVGWKLRPFLGRPDPEPFTADELKQNQDEPGIDGYLIDFAAKGAKVELSGTEKVEGHECYRLVVTSKSGRAHRVWIDGQTFLEAKVEGEPRRMDGRMQPVAIYPSDYHSERGLLIAHLLSTEVQGAGHREKTTLESVEVNPPLDDGLFTKDSLKSAATAPVAPKP